MPERDEQIRTGANAFPTQEGQQQVVAKYEQQHRG